MDEEDPTAFIDRNPVGHFNARGHYRTQTREDVRRGERRRRAMGEAIREQEIGGAGDVIVRFLVVCGILAGTLVIPGLFWGESSSSKGGKKEKEKV